MLHPVALAISFGIITFLHVVFGELVPKTIAISRAPRGPRCSWRRSCGSSTTCCCLAPWCSTGRPTPFTRLLGYPPASEGEDTHTEDEIRTLVRQSARRGMLEQDEEEMVGAVFELNDKVAREIMVPRPDTVTLPAACP